MPRRKPYTKVVKTNQIRAEHVRGMGDIVFKGLQCLNSECQEFIFIRKDEIGDDFGRCSVIGFCSKIEKIRDMSRKKTLDRKLQKWYSVRPISVKS